MNELTNPVNAMMSWYIGLKNLSGSVQFRTTVSGELQWKASNGSTWFKICSLEILRGRSITDVTVNAQNKFVLTFSDLTTQVISVSALEDAVLRATNAAIHRRWQVLGLLVQWQWNRLLRDPSESLH
jgi:hypothetical protein